MKIFYILRGLPGTGKDTFIKKHHLQMETVSTDELRMMFSDPVYIKVNGKYVPRINQKTTSYIFPVIKQALEFHFANSQPVIYNATNLNCKFLKKNIELAHKWGYKVEIIQFGTKITLHQLLKRNENRPEIDKIPNTILKRMYEKYHGKQIHVNAKITTPDKYLV